MRLLTIGSHGQLSLTKDLTEKIPRYAIPSHTWGTDGEEVTFDDLKDEQGWLRKDSILRGAGSKRRSTVLLGGHMLC